MKKKASVLITAISALLLLNVWLSRSSFLRIHFIDVGAGDAILIQYRGESVLIDSGTLLNGYGIAGYLKRHKAERIKYLILTHPDLDHVSGVFFILPKLKVQQIFDNGQSLPAGHPYDWYGQLVRSRQHYSVLKRGDSLRLKDMRLDILWPEDAKEGSFNANSLAIRLSLNNFSAFFAADLDRPAEQGLLSRGDKLKSNLIKIGHHGYNDATSEEFLEAVSPQVAVISAGRSQKLPLAPVLDMPENKDMAILRTDTSGTITVIVGSNGRYKIKTERPGLKKE